MKRIFTTIIVLICGIIVNSNCQSSRINTYEDIGWFNNFATFKLSKNIGIHTEYQWRRDNIINDWMQSLLRVGINYNLNQRVLFRIGYGWIETFPYGEIPINSMGRDFTEHRLFQMIQLSHKEDIIDLSHRFILEQRFVGAYSTAASENEDKFPFLNRLRYMLRIQLPLNSEDIQDNTIYAVFFDEIFIGFGENVNANVFDQNRISAMIGYRLSKNFRFEAGFINQIVQFGRQINGKNVFQNNSGILVNLNYNIHFSKNEL